MVAKVVPSPEGEGYIFGGGLNLGGRGLVAGDPRGMYGPMDIEGHRSAIDGRFYVLDTARLFPCLSWARSPLCFLSGEWCADWGEGEGGGAG